MHRTRYEVLDGMETLDREGYFVFDVSTPTYHEWKGESMGLLVSPGPSPFRYQIADEETGSIYERDLTFEEALLLLGEMEEFYE